MNLHNRILFKITLICTMLAAACNDQPAKKQDNDAARREPGSFGYDLDFLNRHDSVIVLESDQGKARVIVSAKYQAKVFTSTADGEDGRSFGWINYKAFTAAVDSHMNAYGGENRLWLGPEGGRFSLFFPKDAEMKFEHWKTPAAFDTEPWKVTAKDGQSVSLQKDMQLVNYAGTQLSLSVGRSISILNRKEIDELLHLPSGTEVKAVGYQTINTLTNTGAQEWTAVTGMPCIWMLDMFNPTAATTIIIPYKEDIADRQAKVATTDYFGAIPVDRVSWSKGTLLFKADGNSRGKLGINPLRARPVVGSYDALHQ